LTLAKKMTPRVEDLRSRCRDYAARIGAPPEIIVFRESPSHDGSPHVEYDGSDLCFVVTERGCEFERRRTKDDDTLLYWLLRELTHQMACTYELRFRRPGEDFRRQLFEKQLELLGTLKPEWRARRESELQLVLREHPYRDETKG
jgi:hypothetical protein